MKWLSDDFTVLFHIYYHHLMQIMKETAKIWGYKVGTNANIANFAHFGKSQTDLADNCTLEQLS